MGSDPCIDMHSLLPAKKTPSPLALTLLLDVRSLQKLTGPPESGDFFDQAPYAMEAGHRKFARTSLLITSMFPSKSDHSPLNPGTPPINKLGLINQGFPLPPAGSQHIPFCRSAAAPAPAAARARPPEAKRAQNPTAFIKMMLAN